jgi:hypothetical protein
MNNGAVQVAVSNPFDTAMLNAVRFDARGTGGFAPSAPRVELEKALKRYYGVGAETLDEMGEEMPLDLESADRQGNHRGDQEASVIKVRQPGHLGSAQGSRHGHSSRTAGGRTAHPLPH